MGMFGGARRGGGYSTPPIMPDPSVGGYPMPNPRTRTQNIVGVIGDAFAGLAGQPGRFAATLGKERDEQVTLARQMEIARYKAQNPDPTSLMQNAVAAGHQPGTPGYQKFITDNIRQQIWLGNPEAGYVNPGMAMAPDPTGGQSAPPAEAIAQLRGNPNSAAQFDEIFGAGAAQRALGGQ